MSSPAFWLGFIRSGSHLQAVAIPWQTATLSSDVCPILSMPIRYSEHLVEAAKLFPAGAFVCVGCVASHDEADYAIMEDVFSWLKRMRTMIDAISPDTREAAWNPQRPVEAPALAPYAGTDLPGDVIPFATVDENGVELCPPALTPPHSGAEVVS